MTRSARGLAGLCVVLAACAELACSENEASPNAGPPSGRTLAALDPPGADVGLVPGAQATLRVRYTDAAGQPIPDATVRFAIFGDPQGSTISSDSALTDDGGVAQVAVRAGALASRFEVRASAGGARDAVLYIEVSNAGFGDVALTTSYGGKLAGAQLAALDRVTYFLYGKLECAAIDPVAPPPALRERTAPSMQKTVAFRFLPLDLTHTLVVRVDRALSTGAHQPRAWGCLPLPTGTLRAGTQLAVALPAEDLAPRFAKGYALRTTLVLPKSNRPLADALQPWTDLADCPLDPGQLLLDCILDAIDTTDALDCKVALPSAKTLALLAERGTLQQGCRASKTPRGTPSLEQVLHDLAGGWSGSSALGTVEAKGAPALGTIVLASSLELQPPVDGTLVARHALVTVSFPGQGSSPATYKVAAVGLAAWLAYPVKGTLVPQAPEGWGWDLSLEQHGFSLRFGLLARDALGQLVLAPAGLPVSSPALIQSLAQGVQHKAGVHTLVGCPAIEAVACKAARLPPGCLGHACAHGLGAAAQLLDGGFARIDGQHTDLTLAGGAELIDSDGDLTVDRLGEESAPGAWQALLELGEEAVVPKATFVSAP